MNQVWAVTSLGHEVLSIWSTETAAQNECDRLEAETDAYELTHPTPIPRIGPDHYVVGYEVQ